MEKLMMRALNRSPNESIVVFRFDYKVEFVTENAQENLGISKEAIYENLFVLANAVITIDIDELKRRAALLRRGTYIQNMHECINPTTGEKKFFLGTIYRLDRAVPLFMIVLSDRTKEVESEQGLRLSLEMLEAASQAKSNFLANMSHDIRTPLNAILGFAQLIQKNVSNESRVLGYTQKILSSGQHLLSLINDVLDMSKIESGETALQVSEFGLSDLVGDVSSLVSAQAFAKRQSFKVNMYGIHAERILGDKLHISQILINLLSNAVKYTPEGGTINLNLSQADSPQGRVSSITFRVEDTGIGISEEFIPHLFDSFAREQTSTASKTQGTGLGLAIAKKLVELMGGTIAVESQKGVGTTFIVTLPLTLVETNAEKEFWERHGVKQLVVCHKDERVGEDICTSMRAEGVRSYACVNEEELFQLLHECGPIDIVLLEHEFEDPACKEVASRIHEVFGAACPRVILMSDIAPYQADNLDLSGPGIFAAVPSPFFVSNLKYIMNTMEVSSGTSNDNMNLPTGVRVLAAEDNELNAEILIELLKMIDIECVVVGDGAQAVEEFTRSASGYYDIILMDVQMPVMGGYEATRAIRASDHPEAASIPIIAMTANAFQEDVENALNSGMNAHVAKPVDVSALAKTITTYVKRGV